MDVKFFFSRIKLVLVNNCCIFICGKLFSHCTTTVNSTSRGKQIKLPGKFDPRGPNPRFVIPETDSMFLAQFTYQRGNAFLVILGQKCAIGIARSIQR